MSAYDQIDITILDSSAGASLNSAAQVQEAITAIGGPGALAGKMNPDASNANKPSTLANLTQALNLRATYGAAGDGATDDTAAVNSGSVAANPVYFDAGVAKTSLASAVNLSGRFFGAGRIETADGNRRAPNYGKVSTIPAAFGNWSSIDTAFNGDVRSPWASEWWIGPNGQEAPESGYVHRYENAFFPVYGINQGGHNQGTADQTGRTGAVMFDVKVDQYGQGDWGAFLVSGLVASSNPNATHWFAAPAVGAYGAQLFAAEPAAYLNLMEAQLSDNGNDCTGITIASSMFRTNATGALSCTWIGFKSQSVGSAEIDAHFSGSGLARIGLDFSAAVFPTGGVYQGAAITLPEGARIYFGTAPPSSGQSYPASAGNTFVGEGSGNIVMGSVSGGPILTLSPTQAIFTQPLFADRNLFVGANQVVGPRATGWGIPTGAVSRATFATATVTLQVLAETVAALIDDLTSHGLIGA